MPSNYHLGTELAGENLDKRREEVMEAARISRIGEGRAATCRPQPWRRWTPAAKRTGQMVQAALHWRLTLPQRRGAAMQKKRPQQTAIRTDSSWRRKRGGGGPSPRFLMVCFRSGDEAGQYHKGLTPN